MRNQLPPQNFQILMGGMILGPTLKPRARSSSNHLESSGRPATGLPPDSATLSRRGEALAPTAWYLFVSNGDNPLEILP